MASTRGEINFLAIVEHKLTENFLCLFYRYSPSVRANIGRYACFHGIAAAARYFSHKLGHRVSETTVHSIKKAYLEGKKEKRAAEDDDDVTVLPPKKRGRPVLLGWEGEGRRGSGFCKNCDGCRERHSAVL